eukprot:4923404-Ditylum_brightwellii.AAC.1
MGAFRSVHSSTYTSSDVESPCYESAREVWNCLHSTKILDSNAFESIDQDALNGRLDLISKMLHGQENEQ